MALSDEKHALINNADYLIHSIVVYDNYYTLNHNAPYYFENGKDILNLSITECSGVLFLILA